MTAPGHLAKLELALSTAPFATSPTFTDLTAAGHVRSVSWSAGRSTPYGPFSAGSLSVVVDNSERTYDFLATSTVTPNLPIRASVTANSNLRRRFYGFIDIGAIAYGFPDDSLISFSATDGQKFIARETNLGLGDVASEFTDARFARVLDAVSWPAPWRDLQSGSSMMAAATLDIDAISALTAANQAEGIMSSSWFIDRDGKVRFDNRHSPQTRTGMSTIQASFSNVEADVAGSFIGFSRPAAVTSEASLANKATVTGSDGIAASASDSTSVTDYGPLRFPAVVHEALSPSQADVDARTIVSLFKDPPAALSSITVVMTVDGAKFDTVAQLELRDRVRVKFQPPGGGALDDQEYFIESITETADVSGKWTATYGLWPTAEWDALGAGDWLVVGVGKVGVGKVGI